MTNAMSSAESRKKRRNQEGGNSSVKQIKTTGPARPRSLISELRSPMRSAPKTDANPSNKVKSRYRAKKSKTSTLIQNLIPRQKETSTTTPSRTTTSSQPGKTTPPTTTSSMDDISELNQITSPCSGDVDVRVVPHTCVISPVGQVGAPPPNSVRREAHSEPPPPLELRSKRSNRKAKESPAKRRRKGLQPTTSSHTPPACLPPASSSPASSSPGHSSSKGSAQAELSLEPEVEVVIEYVDILDALPPNLIRAILHESLRSSSSVRSCSKLSDGSFDRTLSIEELSPCGRTSELPVEPMDDESCLRDFGRLDQTSQSRYWCFTHYGENAPKCNKVLWAVYQREVCPKTGRLHWQGVVGFVNRVMMTTVKMRLGIPAAHCEAVRDLDRAILYCMKPMTRVPNTQPVIIGSPPRGRRLRRISPTWWQHKTEIALWHEDCAWMTGKFAAVRAYHLCLQAHAAAQIRPEALVWVFHGAPGTGKTTKAVETCNGEPYYVKSMAKFWDGYRGETWVIFDDYSGEEKIADLNRWLDRLPLRVEIKGGSVPLLAWKFIFTSNKEWRKWYPSVDHGCFHRRLTDCQPFNTLLGKPTVDVREGDMERYAEVARVNNPSAFE